MLHRLLKRLRTLLRRQPAKLFKIEVRTMREVAWLAQHGYRLKFDARGNRCYMVRP